jgi:serine/threonine protein phosphatase PrpC
VGVDSDVNMEWRRVDAHAGDWFIVCSDGVYDMVDEIGMSAAFASAHKPEDVIASLSKQIVANGADDNYTMIVVKIGAE